mmetsp:Transcript_55914/g.114270  ORF Transcript_55914/g.114270 Transcript_55914/m.114270 type:complete len:261 (-) Transcript_55914:4284-5066(-)
MLKKKYTVRRDDKIRFWNFITVKESKVSKKPHGFFIGFSFFINCKNSSYLLWDYKQERFGKGNLSRSEPLFFHPNPSFNSIGRASRERKLSKQIHNNRWELESLQLNIIEGIFLSRKNFFLIQNFPFENDFWNSVMKIEPMFFWKFSLFENFRKKFFFLRSGAKFGGNYLVYKKNKFFKIHAHSSAIYFFIVLGLKAKICTKCRYILDLDWEYIQSKARLAQQVSKNIILGIFRNTKKKFKCQCQKIGIFSEYSIERWSF